MRDWPILALKEEEHGRFSTKRCYCSAEFAVKNLAFLQQHSIRAMVNVTGGKNCNDIALAIDAVRLCEADAPALVVIVASDSDFAPLAMHLRDLPEKPLALDLRAYESDMLTVDEAAAHLAFGAILGGWTPGSFSTAAVSADRADTA